MSERLISAIFQRRAPQVRALYGVRCSVVAVAAALGAGLGSMGVANAQQDDPTAAAGGGAGFVDLPAAQSSGAAKASLVAAARAVKRTVAVGDHGIVVLSDDDGKTFHQAKSVPARATLNDVTFVSDKGGWFVAHWGGILYRVDGGET